jgi:hypothetical protein
MPNPFDLLTQKVDPPDPGDQLDQQLGQDQGANLAGGPQPDPNAPPDGGGGPAPPVQPASPNVPGPLAALAPKPVKPKIKLKPKRRMLPRAKPHIKLKLGGRNALL